jgi:hypothetical protein
VIGAKPRNDGEILETLMNGKIEYVCKEAVTSDLETFRLLRKEVAVSLPRTAAEVSHA